jgi:hypothetical protein
LVVAARPEAIDSVARGRKARVSGPFLEKARKLLQIRRFLEVERTGIEPVTSGLQSPLRSCGAVRVGFANSGGWVR